MADVVASQNFPRFAWTKPRADAAIMVAEDALNDEEIATRSGVSRRQLTTWKQHPDFQVRVQEHVAELEASVMHFAVAKKRYRMGVYDDTDHRFAQITQERGSDPDMQDVPGGKTGLVTKQFKVIGTGRDAQVVEEYAADTNFVRTRNANLEQAAKEAGQWAEKTEVTGKDGVNISFTIAFDRVGPATEDEDD